MTLPADRRLRAPSRYGEEAAFWAPFLATGERLLWVGAPARGLRWRREDWLLLPFGFVFFAFSVFWTGAAFVMDGGGFMVLWGIPFVLVGFNLVIGRFFLDARRRARTRYALTDRRALMLEQGRRQNFVSIPVGPSTEIEARPGRLTSIGLRSGEGAARGGQGFEFIEDGESVYRLILDIQQGRAL